MRGALMVVVVLVAGVGVAFGDEPQVTLPPFVVDEATTHFVGPLRSDGTIDYVRAINDRLSHGVTKDNNAAVPLVEVLEAVSGQRLAHYARVRAAMGVPGGKRLAGAQQALGEANFDGVVGGPWMAGAEPESAKWLATNAARLDGVVEASKRERFWMPLVREREEDSMVSILLPHLNEVRQLAEALRARAMLRLGSGDVAGFRGDAVAVVRLGRLLSESGTLVEKLVAAAIESRGLGTIRVAATGGWLPAADAEGVLAELGKLPAGRAMYESFDTVERVFMLEFLQFAAVRGVVAAEMQLRQMLQQPGAAMMGAGLADVAGKDWSKAMRRVNGWYDRLAEAGRKGTYEERRRASEAAAREVQALREGQAGIKGVIAPIEERLLVLVGPAVDRAYVRETTLEASRGLTRVAVALAAYCAKTGAYPDELKELVPAYLKEVPTDPFTGGAFVYKTEGGGYAMQSAGTDGIDGQGAAELSVRAEK
jgi:hypothetical protein